MSLEKVLMWEKVWCVQETRKGTVGESDAGRSQIQVCKN